MKTVTFVTGTRADWGKLLPLARAASANGFRTTFFVTGMHMLKRYGETRFEVRREATGDIYEFVNQSPGDMHDTVLVKTMRSFSDWLYEYNSDLIVVHGDRVEALAVSLVCAMKYIPCAHIEGGEVSGTIDEVYRHCNTKLCRYHFVSSENAAKRVMALGEDPADIFIIGSPELDVHKADLDIDLTDVKKHYDIPWETCGVVIFHPVTSEADSIKSQAQHLFESLEASREKFVIIAPNNDPGAEEIFSVINKLDSKYFRVIPSMRFNYFSIFLRNCALVIGNSSLGVREAPFLGIPSLNIGTRQFKRAFASSIHHASAYDNEKILNFITENWGKRYASTPIFGTGTASDLFAKILLDHSFWEHSKQKVFFEYNSTKT